eukprot:12424657-Karenia_brevis.AAC.1
MACKERALLPYPSGDPTLHWMVPQRALLPYQLDAPTLYWIVSQSASLPYPKCDPMVHWMAEQTGDPSSLAFVLTETSPRHEILGKEENCALRQVSEISAIDRHCTKR